MTPREVAEFMAELYTAHEYYVREMRRLTLLPPRNRDEEVHRQLVEISATLLRAHTRDVVRRLPYGPHPEPPSGWFKINTPW